jgi:hypothetical protein
MFTKRLMFNLILAMVLAFVAIAPTGAVHATAEVAVCDPVLTAGTPYYSSGKVVSTSSVYCGTDANDTVTINTTIKVFRKSDHAWLYDTSVGTFSCVTACTTPVYNPNETYDSSHSYYTWTKVTVNGTSQYTTAGSYWYNY